MKITKIMPMKTNLEDRCYCCPYANTDVTFFLLTKVGLVTNK